MAKQNDIEEKNTQVAEKAAKITEKAAAEKAATEKAEAEKAAAEKAAKAPAAEKAEAEKAAREATEQAARKTAAPKTGNKTPQQRAGEEILAQYPDEPKVYVTSNGFGFFRESEARNHAATLQDKTVITVKRK